MEQLNKWVEYFKNLDLFNQLLLLFAASQIVIIILVLLKEFNIFDATPYMMLLINPVYFAMSCCVIIGILGIIYVLICITLKERTNQSNKNNDDKIDIKVK
jgi:preprotein translocase subunit SecG